MPAKKVLFIVGPTASGKSRIALQLAKKLRGSIISADSMQVYRDMNIGTAKPSPNEMKSIPHYLVDQIPPSKNFSVYEWRNQALRAILEIISERRLPIVVGGSGFYIQALTNGIADQAPADDKVRAKLSKLSLIALHARLKKIDPKSAKKIHPNDQKRLIRALEIYELTGKTRSEWEKKSEPLSSLGYSFRMIGIAYPREVLYARVEKRVDAMIRAGLVHEVKQLAKKRLSKTANQSLSYREMLAYLKGKMTFAEAVDLLKKNTRHFAKRQITWFRHEKRIKWVDADRKSLEKIYQEVRKNLKGWV
ncbi:MAG: tRNA (adenosine(37)-N6)-dimethylallyltransferase MiaA [Candidatus Omnitrophica bacterium]|nr:tRNA (adenosine(37)-N6)-dimethylallyltransferase MiaA [Candidatus Omnitrophota bacterium]